MKTKTRFVCNLCAANYMQWAGQCTQCGAWNALVEEQTLLKASYPRFGNYAQQRSNVMLAESVEIPPVQKLRSMQMQNSQKYVILCWLDLLGGMG